MKNLNRALALLLAVVMVLSMAACGAKEEAKAPAAQAPAANAPAAEAPAEEFAAKPTYTLRFGHTLTEEDVFNDHYLTWAERVYQETKGVVKIDIYPNSQLGVEEDVLEQIRQGANIGWQTDFARGGSYVKELGVMNCPYFLSSMDDVKACLESPTINGWLDQLAAEYGLRTVSFTFAQGYRNVFCQDAAYTPADFSGMRIRTANAAAWLESVNSLGCVATALNYGDIYTGIETKVVEGCELPYPAAWSLNIQEVADYIVETQHIYQCQLLVVSEQWWNTVPAEYQTIIVDILNEEGFKASAAMEDSAIGFRDRMVDEFGLTLISHEELDVEAFKAASQYAYDKLGLADAKAAVYADIGKA